MRKKYFAIFLIVFFVVCQSAVFGDPISDIHMKLDEISSEEKTALNELFILSQEIDLLKKQQADIDIEIYDINLKIAKIETDIEAEEESFSHILSLTEKVLKSYQRMGAGSVFEIIFQSKSLSDFLKRLNILKDFSRNMDKLLEDLNASKQSLSSLKKSLDEQAINLFNKQSELNKKISEQKEIIDKKEAYLEALKDKRSTYEENLQAIESSWDNLKKLFPDLTEEFSQISRSGNLPADVIKVNISLFTVTGILEDRVLNSIIEEYTRLVPISFYFHEDRTVLEIAKYGLNLEGDFILDNNVLRFIAIKGTYYDMPLLKESIDDLFKNGDLYLDLNPLLDGNTIRAIRTKKGQLEIVIIPRLF